VEHFRRPFPFVYTVTMSREGRHSTLYRQYRPQSWDEVRGQGQVTDVLQKAIQNKKLAHAYLFCGPRGTGKTTVARILARELGVSEKDLYEIDAASNTGVDNIRELREAVNVMPFESPYRFYIIDEAHMLSRAAWNAFLKTLEEPPAHVMFVMATTERDKIPDTIQSRCEIYTFRQPTREMLADTMGDVAKSEGYALEKPAAELIALLAEGSFRDALSILQKVLAVTSGKKVDLATVEEVSGAPRGELVRKLVEALAQKDAASALAAIRSAVEGNMDARVLAKLLIHRMRVILLTRFAPDAAAQLSAELPEADIELAKSLAKNPAVNSETLRALLEAHSQMAYAALPHLPLELAVIDICGQAAEK
jgi:DNA polymerase-3 subunit gamma/tau